MVTDEHGSDASYAAIRDYIPALPQADSLDRPRTRPRPGDDLPPTRAVLIETQAVMCRNQRDRADLPETGHWRNLS